MTFLDSPRPAQRPMARTRYWAETKSSQAVVLPGATLVAALRSGYGLADLRRDAMAGAVVGVVALPLAMALAIGVGVPPQAGLATAIVAGFLVAALGGSRTQVTGPTAAFIAILAPIYTQSGMAGLLISGLMAGVLLIAMGLLRLGQLIRFVPHPVTTGFTAGIATVIAVLQLKDFFGLELADSPTHTLERLAVMSEARHTASVAETTIGVVTLLLLILWPRVTRRVPAPLIALPVAAILAWSLSRWFPTFSVATINSRFHTRVGEVVFDGIPRLPPLPSWPWDSPGPLGASLSFSLDELRSLFVGALAIALLGAIESLLSSMVADGMAGTKHDPDAELVALGIGNLVAPFFGGIAATGAIARTATNVRNGARSPVAAMIHAVTVLGAVLAFAPLLGLLPMASLAALLLLVAWNMSELRHFGHILRVAPRSDVGVLLVCYGLTVVFDMVVGVGVGMVLAAFLFMRRMAQVTEARVTADGHELARGPLPPGVAVYQVSGALFFGAAQKAVSALEVVSSDTRAVVLALDAVPVMDATGLVALESAVAMLNGRRCLAVLCGLQPQPHALLDKAGLLVRPLVAHCEDLESALAIAAEHVPNKTRS